MRRNCAIRRNCATRGNNLFVHVIRDQGRCQNARISVVRNWHTLLLNALFSINLEGADDKRRCFPVLFPWVYNPKSLRTIFCRLKYWITIFNILFVCVARARCLRISAKIIISNPFTSVLSSALSIAVNFCVGNMRTFKNRITVMN